MYISCDKGGREYITNGDGPMLSEDEIDKLDDKNRECEYMP